MEETIVFYSLAMRSHIVPMVELGKRLITQHPHFSITVITSTPPFETVSTTSYTDSVSSANPSITFLSLPSISLPLNLPEDFTTKQFEFSRLNNPNFHRALINLSENSKLIKAIVLDFFNDAAFEISTSFNIPTYYFLPGNAFALCPFLYLPTLHNSTSKSLKEVDGFIDIPGLPPVLSHHMPMPMLDRNRPVYKYFMDTAINMAKSAGIIDVSFEAMDERALKAIREGECTQGKSVPPIYSVGPLIEDTVLGESVKEKHPCLSWLDLQPKRSVVYINFGSMGKVSGSQLKEIAIGFEKSGVRFLWVVRNPIEEGETNYGSWNSAEPDLQSLLPQGFLDRTKDRGFVVKLWAPQSAIFSHVSIGGFITHCGWNSVLESVSAGVPMLAWPLFAEQKLNMIALVQELKLALLVNQSKDGFVSATELEHRVIELMNSENGKAVRDRVMAMKEAAVEAVKETGSSRIAIAKLVDSFRSA